MLEIVLGVDDVIFLSILSNEAPEALRARAMAGVSGGIRLRPEGRGLVPSVRVTL